VHFLAEKIYNITVVVQESNDSTMTSKIEGEYTKKYPDLPRNVLKAKGFSRACETPPMLIQEHELIVGHPYGKPRAGAFSPDTAWEWVRNGRVEDKIPVTSRGKSL
jgi:hypothetical protein